MENEAAQGVLTPQLAMLASLEDIGEDTEIALPEGYSLREFSECDGGEAAWDRIIAESFKDPSISFEKLMRGDPEYRPDRVLFICCGDEPVATASAWYLKEFGEDFGVIHMVGALSGHSGRGLGVAVVKAAMRKLKREGRHFARLTTDDFRLPAIKSYLRLGFKPVIVDANQPERWKRIYAILGWAE